jgi:ketosteroid isomerase-like protein
VGTQLPEAIRKMTAAQINSCAWIMRLHAGQVIDGSTFYDSISFNGLWARLRSLQGTSC